MSMRQQIEISITVDIDVDVDVDVDVDIDIEVCCLYHWLCLFVYDCVASEFVCVGVLQSADVNGGCVCVCVCVCVQDYV